MSLPTAGHASSSDGQKLRNLICTKNLRFTNVMTWAHVRLATYTFYEDGATKLIRTGYEVALFRRLKRRLHDRAEPLDPDQVFHESIDAMIDVWRERNATGSVRLNLLEILLIAHNVTRLLARPEQWAGEMRDPSGRKVRFTNTGQNRSTEDRAFPIMLDLRGLQSVDTLPTIHVLAGQRSGLFDHNYIYETFCGQNGAFRFSANALLQPRAVEERQRRGFSAAHWNGGIHYY